MAGEREKNFVEHGVQVGDYRMGGGLGCGFVGDSQPGDGECQETLCFRVKRSARRRSRRSRSFWRKRIKEPRGSRRQHMESGVVELTVMYSVFILRRPWVRVDHLTACQRTSPCSIGGRTLCRLLQVKVDMDVDIRYGNAFDAGSRCWKTRLPGNFGPPPSC
jgi:hypothetical protein